MAGPRYTSEIFGSNYTPPPAPVYTVSTFSALPLSGEFGQKISVTSETLFDNSYPVVVTYENSLNANGLYITGWKLLSARCTYVTLAAAEFNSSNWVGTATIPTSTYANIIDTTYNESWTWNSSGIFLPSYLAVTTINYQKKIKGDTVTLTGWTKTEDTGCSVTTDGSKLTLAAVGTGAQRVATVSFVDSGSTNTTNFYMKCLFQRTNLVAGSGGASHTTMDYWPQSSGGFGAIFGDSRTNPNTSRPDIDGKFFNRSISYGENLTKTSSMNSTLSSEILIQYRAYDYDGNGNTVLQVKVGREGWRDINSIDLPAGAGPFFKVGSYAKGTGGTATCKLRYLQAIRYT